MANINAMLSVISKTSSVDPMEAFNKIRCRLNIVMLDFDFNIFRNWDQGVGSFVVPVTRFGRVDGYDAMTGQVRFDGKANNPDGFKELSMVVTVDLDADSLYVVSAKLYAADELQTTDAVDSVKEGTGYSDEEVKSGKQRSGRPHPEARFPGWKVGKNMLTQKVKNGKKIGQAERKLGEDVEQVDEAGQAKLYRMRYSHGRAWRRGDKKKQDAMGIATYDKQKKEDAKDLNRTGSAFGMRVKRLAGNRKAMGYSESTLIGKQKKLDVNKNKRLDAGDFKALRAKRKPER
jgi:hypothetical protein